VSDTTHGRNFPTGVIGPVSGAELDEDDDPDDVEGPDDEDDSLDGDEDDEDELGVDDELDDEFAAGADAHAASTIAALATVATRVRCTRCDMLCLLGSADNVQTMCR
jgi:hypothetical protein